MSRVFQITSRWAPPCVALLLAAALTVVVIRVSMDHGRLANYPRMDDVMYMARGAELVRAGWDGRRTGGFFGAIASVARNWRMEPPHSPWASAAATMGFAALGVEDWAAYVPTALPVAAFLLAAAGVARRAGGRYGWRRYALIVWAATAPFLAASVYNLKPDYCAGICAAIAMMKALRGPLLRGRAGRLAWVGVWFGLALLAKPAMMIPTILLAGGTLGICAVRDGAVAGWRMRWGESLTRMMRACVIVLGFMALVALPHYAFGLENAWRYARETLTGPGEELWAYHGTRWQHAVYYLTGPGGRLMLDGARSLIPIGIVLGAYVVVTAIRGMRAGTGFRRRRTAYCAAVVLSLVMAWLGPTIVTVKIEQFASCFTALLWLAAVHAAAGLCARTRRSGVEWNRRSAVASLFVAAITLGRVALYEWTLPLPSADRNSPARVRAEARGDVIRAVYEAVRAEARSGARSIAAAGNANDLGPFLLTLWTVRDGIRMRIGGMDHRPGPTADEAGRGIVLRAFSEYDLVLVNEGGARVGNISAAGANAVYRTVAASDPELELVVRVTDRVVGNAFELYRRRRAPNSAGRGPSRLD